MEAQFISLEYLKSNTAISGNVDPAELLPFITEAQNIYIQELLGTRLYNQLVLAVYNLNYASPVEPLSQPQIDLLNIIQPCLAYYTMYVSIPFTMIKWKNKGLQKGANPETGSVSAELIETKYLRENILTTAKFYADRIVAFLCNHNEDYPYYNNQGSNADIYPKTVNSFGFYLGTSDELSDKDKDYLRKFIG